MEEKNRNTRELNEPEKEKVNGGRLVEFFEHLTEGQSKDVIRMRLLNLKSKGWDRNRALNAVYDSYGTIASRELIEKIADMVFG